MLRLGMIGTGNISRGALAPAIAEVDGVELWSVLSRDKTRATEFAHQHQAASKTPGFDDLESFLSDPGLDAVVIATPDKLHAAQAIAAATAKKHVLVEKPMATTVEDAVAMIEACRSAGVRLGVAYHMRWHLGHRELAAKVHRGDFGKIWHARAQWTFQAPNTANWRAHNDVGRWWSLAGVGTHSLDWLRWMLVPVCGEIIDVASAITRNVLGSTHDESAAVSVQFESGAIAQLIASALFSAPNRAEIYGCSGYAYCSETIGCGGGGRIDTDNGPIAFSDVNPYAGEIADFAAAVRDGRDPEVSGEEGRRNIELLCEICPDSADTITL
ncbi:MAG: Gfo/Idh/MocA family oxidoreductase [Arenicellales bacterium]|nr:Gfo/Idh/MocA family oxidoreductase [Arenicellales bacterium]